MVALVAAAVVVGKAVWKKTLYLLSRKVIRREVENLLLIV